MIADFGPNPGAGGDRKATRYVQLKVIYIRLPISIGISFLS